MAKTIWDEAGKVLKCPHCGNPRLADGTIFYIDKDGDIDCKFIDDFIYEDENVEDIKEIKEIECGQCFKTFQIDLETFKKYIEKCRELVGKKTR